MIEAYNIIEDFSSAMKRNTEPKTLILDMDECLVNITPKIYRMISEKKDLFGKYFDLENHKITDVLYRPIFNMERWLSRPEYLDNLPEDITEEFYKLFNVEDFYGSLYPTKLFTAIMEFVNSKSCKEAYVISHCLGQRQIDSKEEFFAKFAPHVNPTKLKFVWSDIHKPKSESITELGIKWDTIIDDNLNVLCDVIRNTESFGNEVIIPSLGYNQPNQEIIDKVKYFNIQLYYLTDDYKRKKGNDVDESAKNQETADKNS